MTQQRKSLIDLIRREETEPYEEAHEGSTGKRIVTGVIKLVAVIGVLIGLLLLIGNLHVGSKTAAASSQVWEAMLSQGYEPTDVTEERRTAWNAGSLLENVIVIEKDDLFFEFSVFDSNESASSLWTQYDSHIRKNLYSKPGTEAKENLGNYRIYTLQVNGKYIVNAQVESTVVYSYADEEDAHILRDILISIGYFFEK